MDNWKCPIEDIDEDIREVVKLLYDNNMKPYMSCSGSYKDHKDKPCWPESACIEMLDSELARELMAMLIKDKRFKCSVSKERKCVFYDNNLPSGFRFKIEFENICGEMKQVLMKMVQSIIKGEKAEIDGRKRIDMVCSLIDAFDVSNGNKIGFSFNDEMEKQGEEDENNYSIEIQDNRDFERFGEDISHAIDEFMQDESKCKIYGTDFLSMLSVLRKIRMDYYQIPRLSPGVRPQAISLKSRRTNRFTDGNNEKMKAARERLEQEARERLFSSNALNFEDLLNAISNETK